MTINRLIDCPRECPAISEGLAMAVRDSSEQPYKPLAIQQKTTGKAQCALRPPSRQLCGSGDVSPDTSQTTLFSSLSGTHPVSIPLLLLDGSRYLLQGPLVSPSVPDPYINWHPIAVKGFLRNLVQLLNHLGLPLLADEGLNHCSLSAEAPHLPTLASPMSLWGPCLEIPPYLQLSHLCPQLAVSSLALSVGTTFSCLIQALLLLSPPGASD